MAKDEPRTKNGLTSCFSQKTVWIFRPNYGIIISNKSVNLLFPSKNLNRGGSNDE